ncbi:uncharacterized protein LTR77_005358 [Saxophila tyrrhenica]|uniref:Amino acid permease/ SLC12A domain-containing protein n=1 Tax=Saxophila tyrrhenica TaxID=1690608 RepID=A0AAV9P921_9PEZI|nr:hypothetical protein LTR77_005358 [Saxophila tyrrhenica]
MGVFDNGFSFNSNSEKKADDEHVVVDGVDFEEGFVSENKDDLQRRLGNRQIQLLAIGGTIGTALFVSIGGGLNKAGPGGLFLAYTIYSIMLALINNCIAEMTTLFPVTGGFIRLAGHFVDDALGFMAGWNFYIYEALLIPFEITALCTVLGFWRDDIPLAAVIAVAIVLYAILNVLAVKLYGEAEFWLSGGKVILIFLLFCFTFVVMVGGNPQHDAFGFRYWNKPGAFTQTVGEGSLGQFEGFLGGLWSASFTVVGPEYISMVSAEAKRPRIYIKNAFKTIYWRFGLFFIVGSLTVGVLIPYNDPKLEKVLGGSDGAGTAAASPYVIAMQNLGITGLPHFVNALLVTSIFSAGNTYTYCSTRGLYGLALEGRAPKFLRYCTKGGVPVYCFLITMIFPCLAFLQLGSGSVVVLNWLIALITAGGVINYIVMSITYIFFYRACKAQGIDRRSFPYYGKFQPYCGWIGLIWMSTIVCVYGYQSYTPSFDVESFFSYYTMLILAPILFLGWKLIKRTRLVPAREVDFVWERPTLDAYEASFTDEPLGFWVEMLQLVGIKKRRGGNDQRVASISA